MINSLTFEAQPSREEEGMEMKFEHPSCSDRDGGELEAVAAAARRRQRDAKKVSSLQHWWGDCQPLVTLLREALLSSAPDIAVVGPLNGCFTFYMTHLHNGVLSSSYAKTMIFGASVTPLESSFMWLGSWRPTSALVLVYSLMGIGIEDALECVRMGRTLIKGSTASLLSARQLSVMHTLQQHTQHAEMKISKKHSILQMLIGDQDVLEAVILDAASPIANDSSRFKLATAKRMSRFRRLLIQAEELRLHTLQDLLLLLTPIQAARCFVAVFELCSAMRGMGSILPPSLPSLAVLPAEIVLPKTQSASSSSGLVDIPLPMASSSHPFLSSDASLSHTIVNSSHILDNRSDHNAVLLPSCSSSSSSPAETPPSAAALLDKEVGSSSFSSSSSSLKLALTPQLKFDPLVSRGVIAENPTTSSPSVNSSQETIISNRLLILSPSSSDVTIQTCTLEPSELPFIDLHQQLPLANEEYNKISCESSEFQPCTGKHEQDPFESEEFITTGERQEEQGLLGQLLNSIHETTLSGNQMPDLDTGVVHQVVPNTPEAHNLEVSLSSLGLYD